MTDYIDRQAAIDALKGLPTWWADGGGYYGGAKPPMEALLDPEDAISAIENLPPAQPEHPKGKWIKLDSYDRRDHFYACSECGRLINIICNAHLEDYPFCHCGADMRGEQDE